MDFNVLSLSVKYIHEETIQENDCGELTFAKLETAMSINIK